MVYYAETPDSVNPHSFTAKSDKEAIKTALKYDKKIILIYSPREDGTFKTVYYDSNHKWEVPLK